MRFFTLILLLILPISHGWTLPFPSENIKVLDLAAFPEGWSVDRPTKDSYLCLSPDKKMGFIWGVATAAMSRENKANFDIFYSSAERTGIKFSNATLYGESYGFLNGLKDFDCWYLFGLAKREDNGLQTVFTFHTFKVPNDGQAYFYLQFMPKDDAQKDKDTLLRYTDYIRRYSQETKILSK